MGELLTGRRWVTLPASVCLRAVWPFLRIISDRWHQRVRLACGHQRRHSGTRERPQKPDKGHWQPGEGKDFKGTVPETWSAESGAGAPQRSNPTRGGGVPGASSGSRAPALRPSAGPSGGNAESDLGGG